MAATIWDVLGSHTDVDSPLSGLMREATATRKHLLVHVDVAAGTFVTEDLDGDEEKLRARFWPKGKVRTSEELHAYVVVLSPQKGGFVGITHGFQFGPPNDGLCRRCRTRDATENWVGGGGVLGFVHGAYERWCARCCTEVQLAHAREQAAAIPDLEKKLVKLGGTP